MIFSSKAFRNIPDISRLASDTRLLIVSIWQSHISAASSHDRPLATARISAFTLLVAEPTENAEDLVGLDTVVLARRRLRLPCRVVERLAQRTVVHPAQGGEHSNLQANPDTRPVHRGEGLNDRLTHKIVGTLTIAGENPGEGAQMGNSGDDVRSPESAPVSQVAAVVIALSINLSARPSILHAGSWGAAVGFDRRSFAEQ